MATTIAQQAALKKALTAFTPQERALLKSIAGPQPAASRALGRPYSTSARSTPARRMGNSFAAPPARPRDTRVVQLDDGFTMTVDELDALTQSIITLKMGPELTARDLPKLAGLVRFLVRSKVHEILQARGLRTGRR